MSKRYCPPFNNCAKCREGGRQDFKLLKGDVFLRQVILCCLFLFKVSPL
jgi:hypothetical protein